MVDKRPFTIPRSEGFSGAATQMHHAHPPTGWRDWDGPLRPRAFDLSRAQKPAGFTHGPHPGALANMFEQPREGTDEIAVMLDARDPLEVCSGAEGIELPDYAMSWASQSKEAAE